MSPQEPQLAPSSLHTNNSDSGSNGSDQENESIESFNKVSEEERINDDATEATLSLISCVACRKLHKKCDRLNPSCSKCKSRGVKCSYNEPKKRGKAAEAYKSTKKVKPNPSPNNAELSQIIYFYYTFISGGNPVIKKAKLEYFTEHYLASFDKKSEIKLKPNSFIANMEELQCIHLLFLSIKSIYYQLNEKLDKAQETMNSCEKKFGEFVPTLYKNFYLNAACQLIAIYYSGVGDFSKTRFYVNIAKFYLSETEKSSLGLYELNLEQRMVFLNRTMDEFVDGFSVFIEQMPKIFEVSVDQKLENLLVPGALEYLRTAPVTRENYVFFKQVIDFVFKVVGIHRVEHLKKMTDCHSETFFKFEQLHKNLIYYGFQMFFLNRIADFTTEVEEVALKISCMTEHECFKYCISEMLIGVKEAATLHLNICKSIENGTRKNYLPFITSTGKVLNIDYYSILEKDCRALKCLRKKYQRAEMACGSIINEIENLLQNHYNSVKNLALPIEKTPTVLSIGLAESSFVNSLNNQPNLDERWKSVLRYLEAIMGSIPQVPSQDQGINSTENVDFDIFFE